MKKIINKIKDKIYCIRIRHACSNCPYSVNNTDYWGCTKGFGNH